MHLPAALHRLLQFSNLPNWFLISLRHWMSKLCLYFIRSIEVNRLSVLEVMTTVLKYSKENFWFLVRSNWFCVIESIKCISHLCGTVINKLLNPQMNNDSIRRDFSFFSHTNSSSNFIVAYWQCSLLFHLRCSQVVTWTALGAAINCTFYRKLYRSHLYEPKRMNVQCEQVLLPAFARNSLFNEIPCSSRSVVALMMSQMRVRL